MEIRFSRCGILAGFQVVNGRFQTEGRAANTNSHPCSCWKAESYLEGLLVKICSDRSRIPYVLIEIAPEFPRHTIPQALESLAREIDRLEADVLDPALSSAATDPAKACSRLEAYRHRLSDLEVSTR